MSNDAWIAVMSVAGLVIAVGGGALVVGRVARREALAEERRVAQARRLETAPERPGERMTEAELRQLVDMLEAEARRIQNENSETKTDTARESVNEF